MGDLRKYNYLDYDELLISGSGISAVLFQIFDIPGGDELPEDHNFKGIIISGSNLMITEDHIWKEPVSEWLRNSVKKDIPVLGICFGHQLLAYSLGGEIGDNPAGIELGTTLISVNEDGRTDELLLEFHPGFYAQASHIQSVLKLPENAVILASSNLEPFQAFRLGNLTWGIQFHPEFDEVLMKKIIEYKACNGKLKINKHLLIDQLKQTGKSFEILRRFGDIIKKYLN